MSVQEHTCTHAHMCGCKADLTDGHRQGWGLQLKPRQTRKLTGLDTYSTARAIALSHLHGWGAWLLLAGGAICLANSTNE